MGCRRWSWEHWRDYKSTPEQLLRLPKSHRAGRGLGAGVVKVREVMQGATLLHLGLAGPYKAHSSCRALLQHGRAPASWAGCALALGGNPLPELGAKPFAAQSLSSFLAALFLPPLFLPEHCPAPKQPEPVYCREEGFRISPEWCFVAQ